MNNAVSLNVNELQDFLTHIITNNRHLQEKGKNMVSTEVVGESGIGKTSSIKQLAENLNLDFVKINLAQIDEVGDLVGFPTRQFQMAKKDEKSGNWTTKWADEQLVEDYKKKVPKEIRDDMDNIKGYNNVRSIFQGVNKLEKECLELKQRYEKKKEKGEIKIPFL